MESCLVNLMANCLVLTMASYLVNITASSKASNLVIWMVRYYANLKGTP